MVTETYPANQKKRSQAVARMDSRPYRLIADYLVISDCCYS